MPDRLPSGLYDLLVTDSLVPLLQPGSSATHPLSDTDHERLAEALAAQLGKILAEVGGEGHEKALHQLELVNALLVDLRARSSAAGAGAAATQIVETLAAPPRILTAIRRGDALPTPPETGLAAPWLFTAGKGSPPLLQEIRRELAACDGVDILVSFITMSGVRKLLDIFQHIAAVAADGTGRTRIRVLTTTYTGATEARALDEP